MLPQSNREFLLQFEKVYRWLAQDASEKQAFLFSVWKACTPMASAMRTPRS